MNKNVEVIAPTKCLNKLNNKEIEITNKIKELENKLADNKDLELSRKEKLEQINNITKILKEYPGLTKFNKDIFNNLVDRIIIGEKLDNGTEDLYKFKFILKTGEIIKDNLPNNKLKIGTDIGHYSFKVNKQILEIKEENVSAYVLHKNSYINSTSHNFSPFLKFLRNIKIPLICFLTKMQKSVPKFEKNKFSSLVSSFKVSFTKSN